jgi:hypothetical protein
MAVEQKNLDMAKMRERLERLRNPGAFRNKKPLWRPNDKAEDNIRMIPYPHGDDPFVELYFHFRIGEGENSNFLCPRMTAGQKCPACSFANELIKSDSEQDKKLAKDLFAKQRIYAVVVDRADETKTPKLWGFGKTVYQTLLAAFEDEDLVGFLDLYKGLDLKVRYIKAAGKTYPDTSVKFARKESALAESDAEIAKILDKVPTVESIYQPITFSQIQAQMDLWLKGGDADPEKESTETVKGGTERKDSALLEDASETGIQDIDAAFEEALG